MALIKCPECGKKISDKSKVCCHCGYPIQPEDIKPSVENIDEVGQDGKKPRFFNRHKAVSITLICLASTLVVGTAIGVPVGLSYHYTDLYEEIIEAAKSFDNSSSNIIHRNAKKLPRGYKDIDKYLDELAKIDAQIQYLDGHSSSNEEGSLARNAFKNLTLLRDELTDWNLYTYMNYPSTIASIMTGVIWAGDGYDFYWRYEDGHEYFSTSIPNNKRYDASYYFYFTWNYEGLEMGYENTANEDERIKAYLLSDPTYSNGIFKIDCKCYANGLTYSLIYKE